MCAERMPTCFCTSRVKFSFYIYSVTNRVKFSFYAHWMQWCLTSFGRLVGPAVTGGSVFEVVLAVIWPQAAVVEAEHVVLPVREAWDPWRLFVRRGTPVMPAVRCTAPDGVTCQHLGTCAVIATLLTSAILRARMEKSWQWEKSQVYMDNSVFHAVLNLY